MRGHMWLNKVASVLGPYMYRIDACFRYDKNILGLGIQDTTLCYIRKRVAHSSQFFSSHHQNNIWSALLSNVPILL